MLTFETIVRQVLSENLDFCQVVKVLTWNRQYMFKMLAWTQISLIAAFGQYPRSSQANVGITTEVKLT
jgi:hypothetical protein